MDAVFSKMKLSNLSHEDNKYVAEGALHEPRQVAETAICFKSVNYDINLTEELIKVYPDLYFIALSRNGYALCDGYLRRDYTAADFGRICREIAEIMGRHAKSIPRFKMVKFEDVLDDPFGAAEDLYWFTRDTIGKLLDPGIDDTQMNRLSADSIRDFEEQAGPALKFFGYDSAG
jgi:hypothetical protein